MKNTERIVWLGCILLVIITSIIGNTLKTNNKEPQQPTIRPVINESREVLYMKIFVKTKDSYVCSTDFSYNGIGDNILTVETSKEGLYIEIGLIELEENIQSFQETIEEEIFDGPDGWKYYLNPNWDSTPNTKVYENIKKVYFKEQGGATVRAYVYDYIGGGYDEEIDQIIENIEII